MHSCRAPLALLLGCTACSALTTASVRACSQPAIQSSRAATSAITADANAALAGGFMLKPLPAAKAMFLLLTWAKTASDQRSAGFQPESEAIGERANKLKDVAKELDRLKALANILALAERGSVSFDKLSEPHASQGEALSRTKVVGAISAGKGSAIAFVSSWDEHVSVDAIIINPAYLIAGEEAELALLDYVVEEARKDGIEDIRLRAPYQVSPTPILPICHSPVLFAHLSLVISFLLGGGPRLLRAVRILSYERGRCGG